MSSPDFELALAWQRHVATDEHLLGGVLSRHREKHRRYHTATHVMWVVRHVEELASTEPVERLDEVVAAAIYHDAVCEPEYPANERASARLARRDLTSLGWHVDATERVGAMIEATEHLGPTSPSVDVDTAVLLDADLAILGAEPAAYAAYAAGIREEYRHVDDDAWRTGRSQVLQQFLDRPRRYLTETAHDRWDDRARANLDAELATLNG